MIFIFISFLFFSLSGKEHSVFTGVAIVLCHEKDGMFYSNRLAFGTFLKLKVKKKKSS